MVLEMSLCQVGVRDQRHLETEQSYWSRAKKNGSKERTRRSQVESMRNQNNTNWHQRGTAFSPILVGLESVEIKPPNLRNQTLSLGSNLSWSIGMISHVGTTTQPRLLWEAVVGNLEHWA